MTKPRQRPARTDKIREQDRKRWHAAKERRLQRQSQLGAQTIPGEIYQATGDQLSAMANEVGAENIEIIANLIHRAFELRERDPVAYAAMISHDTLPEVWHG